MSIRATYRSGSATFFLAGLLTLAWLTGPASAQTSAAASQPAKSKATSAKAKAPIGVEFDFDSQVTEQAVDEDFMAALSGKAEAVSLREWVRRLNAAAENEQVSAVLLMIDSPGISWPQVMELRPAIEKIRKAGKPVIAYADDLGTASQFLLAAAADKVYISRAGGVWLNGLLAETMYYKTLMDKLGVAGDFIHIGAYKGATEPFTLTGPTKEAQEMTNWLLDDLYAQLSEEVGKARGKDATAGKKWIDGGPYTAPQALAAGLVDGFKSRTEVIGEVKMLAGLKPAEKLNRRFAEKKANEIDFGNPFAIFKIFAEAATRKDTGNKPAIGLIYVEGLITEGESEDSGLMGKTIGSTSLISAIEKARKDDNVKAVVLRINSPGGSATASDITRNALLKLKAEKPLVVSVGGLAASGGYYMAVAGERIFVYPDSLIGSIGVWGGKVVMKGLFDWIGVSTFRYTRGGPRTALFDITQPFTDEERTWIKGAMNEAYELFTQAVKEGRGDKLKDFEAKIVGGKVFTGRQGIANGLADQVGTLQETIAYAADKAGLKKSDYEVKVIPRPLNFIEKLVESMGNKRLDDEVEVSSGHPLARTAHSAAYAQLLPWLKQLQSVSPAMADAVVRQLQVLTMLGHARVMMVQPDELVIGR